MPEGDTIHRLAAEVMAKVGGRRATWSTFRHPRLATVDVSGRVLVDVTSHGKHLFLHFDDDWSLHIHLLMDGRVRFGGVQSVEEWRRRFEIVFEGGIRMTGIDIPLLHRVRTGNTARMVDHLGPDLCGRIERTDLDAAVARLVVDPSVPLSGALLDQRNVAGFGNIYAVEVPFICGLSPFRPIGEVAGLPDLLAIGTALIRTNARLGPQNTTGRRLERTEHWVLSDRPRSCPHCGTAVNRLPGDATPWRRRTAWCPSCQPETNDTVDVARARKLLGLHPARRQLDFEAGDRGGVRPGPGVGAAPEASDRGGVRPGPGVGAAPEAGDRGSAVAAAVVFIGPADPVPVRRSGRGPRRRT